MATEIWVNIGSGNGLWHQAITWTNVDWSSVKSNDIHIRAISQQMPQPSITKFRLKITCLEFQSNFPGASELLRSVAAPAAFACKQYMAVVVASWKWRHVNSSYRDFISAIHKTGRVIVTRLYFGWCCVWATLVDIFMLVKDMINVMIQ